MHKGIVFIVVIVLIGLGLYFLPSVVGGRASSTPQVEAGKKTVSAQADGYLYFSKDNGETFTAAEFDSIPGSVAAMDYSSTGNTFYAIAGNGIFVSSDAGLHWQARVDADKKLAAPVQAHAIAADPQDPKRVYVSLTKGQAYLYVSDDALATVKGIYESSDGIAVNNIEFNSGELYLGMSNGQVLAYNPGLHTFRDAGMLNSPVVDIVVKPGGVMYAATNDKGIFIKTGERSWDSVEGKNVSTFSGAKNIQNLSGLGSYPQSLYAASLYGIIRTNDYGKTWTSMSTVVPQKAHVSKVLVTDSGTIFAAKEGTLYRSRDDGNSWTISSPIPADKSIGLLESYSNGNLIFVGTAEQKSAIKGFFPYKIPNS